MSGAAAHQHFGANAGRKGSTCGKVSLSVATILTGFARPVTQWDTALALQAALPELRKQLKKDHGIPCPLV